jgi:hypothetical protein
LEAAFAWIGIISSRKVKVRLRAGGPRGPGCGLAVWLISVKVTLEEAFLKTE